MLQKFYNVYTFDELPEESKQKAIDKWYETEDYCFLTDDLSEDLKANDKNIFEDKFNLSYSLSYCQGDGLSIKGSIDLEKFMRNICSKRMSDEKITDLTEKVKVFSNGNQGHYCYASTNDIDYEIYADGSDDEIVNVFRDEILPEIQDHYMSLCRELERTGYDILDYRMNFKEFTELCQSNNYYFRENGTLD